MPDLTRHVGDLEPAPPMSDNIRHLNTVLEGRYRVERELGKGGAATVYLAWDLKHQRNVALKVLMQAAAEQINIERFSREIEIVAGLTHPHILPLHDSGDVDGIPFFVMPFLDGGTLRDRLDDGAMPHPEAVQITIQIAEALQAAHESDILHRDVKPENILLSHGHAVLSDFGIAGFRQQNLDTETGEPAVLGTPSYMSPEQATGESELDVATDLYSLGCVLFEMLTGSPPFESATRMGLVTAHLTASPPDPSKFGVEISSELQGVLDTLLAKAPAERPSSASALLKLLRRAAAGSASARALGSGRAEEEARILGVVNTAEGGTLQAILLEGDAGIGKSTLLASVERQAQVLGIPTLGGQAQSSEGAAAYQAWHSIVESALQIRGLSDADSRRQKAVAALGDEEDLVRLAPLLNDILQLDLPESTSTERMDGASRAQATQELVAGILRRFAGGRTLLILLDDIQWLDGSSWALLLRSLPEAGTVVAVLSSRPGRDSLSREAQELLDSPGTLRMSLSGLDPEAIGQVAEHAIGASPVGAALSRWLHERADGNPFYAREIALALVEGGQVVVSGGQVVEGPTEVQLGDLALPATVEDLVLSRIDRLGTDQQVVLSAASVLGRRFYLRELMALHDEGASDDQLVERLKDLVSAQLLVSQDDVYAFPHLMTRDVTYGTLGKDQRATYHRRFAEWMESDSTSGATREYARLAEHWREAGVIPKTLECLELASLESIRRGAFGDAVESMTSLLALDDRQGRTSNLQRRGHWNGTLAHAYVGLGGAEEGTEHAAIALEQLGSPLPRSRFGWVLMATRQAVVQTAHLVRSPKKLPLGTDSHQRALDVVTVASIQADHRYRTNDTVAQIGLILLAANTADRMEPTPGSGRPVGVVGALVHMIGLERLGWRYLERSRTISAAAGDVASEARAEMIAAAMRFWSGELRPAKAAFLKGEELAERHGLSRELVELWGVASNVDIALGNYDLNARRGRLLVEGAKQRSSSIDRVWGLLVLAKTSLRLGRLDEAKEYINELRRVASRLEHQERVSYEAIEVLLQLQREDWPQLRLAVSRLSESLGVGSRSNVMIWAHWQSFSALCDGRLTLLDRAGDYERRNAADDANRACKAHLKFAKTFPVSLPYALLARGRVLCLEGDPQEGSRVLEKARGIAEKFGDPYAQARATDYLALAEPAGSDKRSSLLETARESYASLGCSWEEAVVNRHLRDM